MDYLYLLSLNAFDLNFGQLLSMSIFYAVTFSAFLFENNNFIILQMIQHFGFYRYSLYEGLANGHFPLIVQQQHFVEINAVSRFLGKAIYIYLLTFFHLKLESLYINYCVHFFSFGPQK